MSDRTFSYMSTDWLQGHEVFIEKFMEHADVRFFKKGEFLFRQNENLNELFLILKGTVESFFESESGKQKITSIIRRGMLVGMAGLNDYEGHHTLRCRTAVIAGVMPKEAVYEWDSAMLLALIQMQTRKIRATYIQMMNQSSQTIETRILNFLLEAGLNEDEPGPVEIPVSIEFSKQEIANIISSTRERVNQIMNDLEKRRIIQTEGKEIRFYPSKVRNLLTLK